jgi:glycosyltransferase involved in cell wall biosynthesis
MKIAYVSDSIYPYNKGGKEKRLYELSTRIAKQGHDVHIYTMHWWKSPEKTIKQDGLTLHAITKKHEMYKGNRRSIKQGILFGLACFKLIKAKFDVIDVDHMPFFPVYSAWVVCLLKRKKLYGTWHEALSKQDWINYMGKLGIIAYYIEKLSIKLPYKISVSSHLTIQNLREYHGRKKGLTLITPGVDFVEVKNIKPSKNKIDVLYVGRLVKDKNVDVLINSIGILVKKSKNLSCLIIGQGPEKDNLIKLIQKHDLRQNVILIGPLKNSNDIYAQMKSSKVFALPSVREGFGMVAIESLACNTPVITTNAKANAAKDLIIENKNGSVIKLNEDNLAIAIQKWLTNNPSEILKTISHEYDWDALATKQIGVYKS